MPTIARAIRRELEAAAADLVGVCRLAEGGDQLFATNVTVIWPEGLTG